MLVAVNTPRYREMTFGALHDDEGLGQNCLDYHFGMDNIEIKCVEKLSSDFAIQKE